MNITVNITEPIKRVQEFKEYDLGQITTTLQDLLDNSSIIVDSNIIPILKVLTIDNIVKNYLIKDLTENIYNTGEYITGQDLTENDLLLITGESQGSGINTAFVEKTYAPTMSVAYDSTNPNFDITLTGNLDLTITGTSNGDSGLVNLYFSSTEVATLNGFADLVVIGAGEMIPIYFIHDSDGLKWYNDVTGGAVDTSTLALQDGTILYHLAVATNIGTFSNVGNVCTGIGTSITNEMIGAKIKKANGEIGIIATRTSNTEFTTEVDFLTDSVDTTFEVRCIEHKINIDGSVNSFDKIGVLRSYMEENGTISNNYLNVQTNGNITTNGYQFSLQNTVFLNGAGYVIAPFFKNRVIYTAATLPLASDVGNGVHAFVSDALAPTYLGILVGGGTINCAVFSNGTDWITH